MPHPPLSSPQVEHLAMYNDQAVPLLGHLRRAHQGLLPREEREVAGDHNDPTAALAVPWATFKRGRFAPAEGQGDAGGGSACAVGEGASSGPPLPARGSVAAAAALGAATGLFRVWQPTGVAASAGARAGGAASAKVDAPATEAVAPSSPKRCRTRE